METPTKSAVYEDRLTGLGAGCRQRDQTAEVKCQFRAASIHSAAAAELATKIGVPSSLAAAGA